MTDREHSDHIIAITADIRADVILGKNLELHYAEAVKAIETINQKVDDAVRGGDDRTAIAFRIVGYELYRLKDDIIKAVTETR